MRLTTRLLLVSLVTLLLPWAGCQYLRDVETALRQGQAESLAASATAVAAGLSADQAGAALSQGRFAADRTPAPDIYAHTLGRRPVLDGFVDDWGLPAAALERVGQEGFAVSYVAAREQDSLYLFLDVADDEVVYGEPGRSDRVRLRTLSAGTGGGDLIFTTRAPGRLNPVTPDGRVNRRVEASWQPTSRGYGLEIRLPAAVVGDRLGFLVTDYRRTGERRSLGTLSDLTTVPGWVVHRVPAVEASVTRSALPGSRLRVVDSFGYILADTGPVPAASTAGESPILRRLVRLALGADARLGPPPGTAPGRLDPSVLDAALDEGRADLRFRSGRSGRVLLTSVRRLDLPAPARALLVAEQDTDAILSATDRAATRLVLASFLASISAVLVLLGFAAWLSWRIGRLSSAASRALTGAGEIRPALPDAGSGDELGALSRDFSLLLGRVAEYNAYLKTLGQKLTHELRTPMAVVRTSLENLQADPGGAESDAYLRRAREGLHRLQAMVSALGAATRVEQAMASADIERFDLAAVARELFAAYADSHPGRRMEIRVPDTECPVRGSPELVAQMLDKLFENALDFCPPDGRIRLSLGIGDRRCRLSVANSGSRLADGMEDQLFESLVSAREKDAETPHLGLGLYIARLIARHHEAGITACNLPGDGGVEFLVDMPLAASAPE